MFNKKEKILLFGYGKYGENIAQQLRLNGHEVYIVDYDKNNLNRAYIDKFEHIFEVDIQDDEQLLNVLKEDSFKRVFCAFDDEEKNVYLTITLRALVDDLEIFSVCESKRKERKLKLAGVDTTIDVVEIIGNRLFFVLEKPAVTEALDEIFFKDPNLTFQEVAIPKNSFLDGVNIDEIDFKKYKIIVIGIVDKELGDKFTFITKGIRHKIDADDILVVVGYKQDIENFKRKLIEGRR